MPHHHLKNGRFRNNADLNNVHSSLSKALKWQLDRPKVTPLKIQADTQSKHLLQQNTDASQLCWIGHATFLIQHDGLTILTDPVFSKRASPVQFAGPKRVNDAALTIEELPHVDIVVVSHDHYDHLDKGSVLALARKQKDKPPMYVVPLKLGLWLTKRGIHDWVELDWWQSASIHGWTFTAVPVQHFSGRGLIQNNTLWAGWVIESPKGKENFKRMFFAGDTGYSDDFNQIGKTFGEFDLSLIPIGAYEPRWFMREVHVNPEEAVKIHQDVNSKFSVAMHWGSFILTDEQLDEPPQHLELAKSKLNVPQEDFICLTHGQVLKLATYWK